MIGNAAHRERGKVMARPGFIHDKLDIKFLILYLAARLTGPVDFATLTDLAMCDDGVIYFDYAEALAELVDTEHLTLENGEYTITEKGRRNGSICESSLPYSIRLKCDRNLTRVNTMLRRNAQIRTEILPREDEDGFTLRLIFDDNTGNLMTLDWFTVSVEQAQMLGNRFREHPEAVYHGILDVLLPSEQKLAEIPDQSTEETPS